MSGISSVIDSPNRFYSRAVSFAYVARDAMTASPTEEAAKHEKLATVIKERRYSPKDWEGWKAIDANVESKERFFSNPNVQRKLVKALMMGNYLNPDIIQELKRCTPCIPSEEQQTLFDSKFLWMMDGLQSRSDNYAALRFFTALTPDRQNKLANVFDAMPDKTVSECERIRAVGKKGAATYAATFNGRIRFELARNLSLFSDKDAQKTIAKKIDRKTLGTPVNLKETAEGIIGVDQNKVSSQKFLALDAAIENVGCLTDPGAQQNLVQAIVDAITDRNLGVSKLVSVTNKITAFDPKAQQNVLDAIFSVAVLTAQSDDESEMRKKTMENVNQALSAFINPEAKKKFVQRVAGQLAGEQKWLSQASVQSFFAQTIQDGMLDDSAVIKTMVDNLPVSIDDASAHSLFQSALHYQPLLPGDIKVALEKKLLTIQTEDTYDQFFIPKMLGGVGAAAVAGIQYWIFG